MGTYFAETADYFRLPRSRFQIPKLLAAETYVVLGKYREEDFGAQTAYILSSIFSLPVTFPGDSFAHLHNISQSPTAPRSGTSSSQISLCSGSR